MANYKNIPSDRPTAELAVKHTADALLQASDWTQLSDSGLTTDCVEAFKTYRAAIRAIRKTNPTSPNWPDAPNEVDA